MQTFLPYPSFARSAAALDPSRLGKQRVEAFQLLRANTIADYGWRHHPAAKMWSGHLPALVVLNLRAVLNTQTAALGILMTCATAWLQAMIEAETDERSTKRIAR